MNDTQRGDKAPTTGSNDSEPLTDGGSSSGPDWEKIARRKMSVQQQIDYDSDVATHVHRVHHAIEEGEDPTANYWTMVSRFGEYANRVGDELVSTGDLASRDPRVELHSASYFIQDELLRLGKAIENESVGESFRGDEFDDARRALAQAEDLVDELEAKHGVDTEGGQ